MKESNNEDSTQKIFDIDSLRDSLERAKKFQTTQFKGRSKKQHKTAHQGKVTGYTFERILNDKARKQEEKERIKMEIKSKKKLIHKINRAIAKDYIQFFFLLFTSSLNFNYLFLPFSLIGVIYLPLIGSFKFRLMRLKYFLEIFVIGYASYLLMFKLTIFTLIKNENETVLVTRKNLYIDLGICILKDRDSYFYFIMNFLPEIIIIIVTGYSIIISFKSRLLTPKDLRMKTITNLKLSKYAFIIYTLMIVGTIFNLSFLSLFYIICIQLIIFLCSIKAKENAIKFILKCMIYLILALASLQILIVNFFNVHSVKRYILEQNEDDINNINLDKYYFFSKIGILVMYKPLETNELIIKLVGYFSAIIVLIILINTRSKLDLEVKQEKQENESDNNIQNNVENDLEVSINKLAAKKSIFYKIISKIMKFLYHPAFNFEVSRILAIIWTYFYRNIFSFGIIIFVFISFLNPHAKRNKYLVIFILSPMLVLSLGFFHISNIRGILEDISDTEKIGYRALGLKKYDNIYLEYPLGHIFFSVVMFLINSLYTYEDLLNYDNSSVSADNSQVIEMQDLSNINSLKESILHPNDEDNKNDIRLEPMKTINEINDDLYDNEDSDSLISYKSKGIFKSKTNRPNKDIHNNLISSTSNDINASKISIRTSNDLTFINLIKKILLQHIDKITLLAMYFVSIYTVNVIHVLLVVIFIIQIISPGKLNYIYKINIVVFQIFYIIEFIIDLFKSKYYEEFKNHKNILQFFVVYNEDINCNDLEILIYAVIYCFYFQYRTCNITSNKNLLNNKKISFSEWLKKMKLFKIFYSQLKVLYRIYTYGF